MTSEQIYSKLDEQLANPKTKNFINHLVKNYIPINRVRKVEEAPKGEFKCTIVKNDLNSYEDFLKTNESVTQSAELKEPISNIIDNNELALTGQNTNTYMSYKTYKIFYGWVVNKLTSGDKHVSWLLGDLNRRDFVNRFNNIETKENNKSHSKSSNNERATFALGDLSALQELKKKMK